MSKEIITFSNIEIEKQKFHYCKEPIFDKYYCLIRFLLVKKYCTVLVIKMIIKLDSYIYISSENQRGNKGDIQMFFKWKMPNC